MIRLETRSGKLIATYLAETDREAVEAAVRDRVSLKRLNAAYMDLRGADLRGADLTHADLRHANLRGADLRRASLRGVDYTGALFDDRPLIDNILQPLPSGLRFTPAAVSAATKQRLRLQAREDRKREQAQEADRRAMQAHRRIVRDKARNARSVQPLTKGEQAAIRHRSRMQQIGSQARAASAALRHQMAQHKEQHP